MNRLIATIFISFFGIQPLLGGYSLDLSTSYDHFRGIPDGSWNGNTGAVFAANGGMSLSDCIGVQAGGSYGLYNWDGRGNVVFANPQTSEQIGLVTAGVYGSFMNWTGGIVYDGMYTKNFSIFDVTSCMDQLRFQAGYVLCGEEVGVWGTHYLKTAHKNVLGLPVSFRAINQLNLFWSHSFQNRAETTLWIGMPYRNSLMFPDERAGNFIAGFSFRAPLTNRLSLDGYGSYMSARHTNGFQQSCNYDSSISVGLTYSFGGGNCSVFDRPYMSIANHSNFFVDTNVNN